MRRRCIASSYLRTWFLIDLISTMPWETMIRGVDDDSADVGGHALLRMAKLGKLMRVMRLLRLAKLAGLLKRVSVVTVLSSEASYRITFAVSIAKMCLSFGIVCHWAACIWGWIGDPINVGHASAGEAEYDVEFCTMGGPCEGGVEGSPWRRRYGLDNYSILTQYFVALHFTTGLITGGDMVIQPGYLVERIFTTVAMIFGVLCCSVIVSQVLLIMSRKSEMNLAFEEQLQRARDFLVHRKVPLELQAKIRRYLEAQFKMQMGLAGGYREFMTNLSPGLHVELTEHLNRTVITYHPFFKSVPRAALRCLCHEAEPVLYAPGDVVVELGHFALRAFFIVRGKLRVVKGHGRHHVYLEPPSWVGDKCLFVEHRRTHTVVAVKPTETLALQKSSLLSVCCEFPDMEVIYQTFQRRVLSDEASLRCPICLGLGHSEDTCPRSRTDCDSSATSGSPIPRRVGVDALVKTPWV